MNSDMETQGVKSGSRLKKAIVWILSITAAIALLLFFVVPIYLSSDSGTNMLVSKINDAVDGEVGMSDMSIGWFSGVKMKGVSFADGAGTTSVNVKEISTKPKYGSLLSGQVELGKTIVDEPKVVINVQEGSKSAGKKAPADVSKGSDKTAALPLGNIDLEVIKGNVVINHLSEGMKQTVEFRDITSKFDINAPGKKSTFNVSLAVAGEGVGSTISASGDVTPPKSGWTLKGTSGDFTIKIDDLDLARLGPLFALSGKEMEIAGILNADIDASIFDGKFKKLNAQAVLDGFRHVADGKSMVLSEPVRLNAEISSVADKVRFDRLNINSSFCKIDCSGGLEAVDYKADVNLDLLQDFAGQFSDFGGYDLAGMLLADGKVTLGDTIRAVGDYSISNFVVGNSKNKKTASAAKVAVSGTVIVDKNKETIGFERFNLTSDPVSLQLSGSTSKSGGGSSAINAKGNVDLGKLQPFLMVAEALPEDMTIGGLVETDVSVKINASQLGLTTDNTTIKNIMIKKADQATPFEEPMVKLKADILADMKDKSIDVRRFELDSTSVKIIKGNLKKTSKAGKTNLSGHLDAQYDLAQVSSMLAAFVPDNLTMAGKRTASLNFASNYPDEQSDKLLANMNADVAFGFDSAEYMGLNIGKADMNVAMKNGVMEVKPFSATANGGTLNFGGSADFNKTPTMFNLVKSMQVIDKVNINDKMSRQLLTYVNPLFAKAVNVNGTANLHCERLSVPIKGGDKNDVVVAGTIEASDIVMSNSDLLGQILAIRGLNQQRMAILPTKFLLENGILSYDDMQINIGDSPLNFGGSIGLDKSINMGVALPYTTELKSIRTGQEDISNRLRVRIAGTAVSPAINVGNLVKENIGGLIEGMIKEKAGVKDSAPTDDKAEQPTQDKQQDSQDDLDKTIKDVERIIDIFK